MTFPERVDVELEDEPPPPQATNVPSSKLIADKRNAVLVCTMILLWVIMKFITLESYPTYMAY
jgi:hypothetical protein